MVADGLDCGVGQKGELKALDLYNKLNRVPEGAQVDSSASYVMLQSNLES